MSGARLSPILSGVAGQYFVAAELSRRGLIASITLRNTRGIDVLAANSAGTRSVGIQVKTNQDAAKKWLLTDKAEHLVADNLFYVFVNLNGPDGVPAYHIVEARVVAAAVAQRHRAWLAGARPDGGPRKDTSMRAFRDPECVYLNAWHRLGLDPA